MKEKYDRMKDQAKTKEQLLREVGELRRHLSRLEKSKSRIKQAEKEFRNLSNIHSLILDNDLMGVAFVRERVFEWVNPKFGRLLGMPPERIVGSSTRLMYTSEKFFQENGQAIYSTFAKGQWFGLELTVPRADQTTFTGRIVGKALDPSAPQQGSLWIFEDITDCKQAEQNWLESEEKYRLLVENSHDLIWTLNADGIFTYASPSWRKILGYETTDIIGSSFRKVVHPDDIALCLDRLNTLIRDPGQVPGLEYRVQKADGSYCWHAASGTPVSAPDGSFVSMVGISYDITNRKKIENDLRASEEHLSRIVETSNAGIILMTLAGKILFANRQMAKMLGCGVQKLSGTSYYDYVGEQDQKEISDNIKRLQNAASDPVNAERCYLCRDGVKRWGYVSGGRIDDADGSSKAVLVISDITDIKRMEAEKAQWEAHMRQTQKLEAIGTLAGGIAHDFNNILASMIGFTEMAASESRQEVRQDYLKQVLLASERAKSLVSRILSFSRQREQERRPLDVRLMVKEALSLLRATLPSTIEIQQTINVERAVVMADATQVHQILMNLCTNAAHAMENKGGVLGVGMDNIHIESRQAFFLPELQPGDYIRLTVKDNGNGIDPAVKDKIFDPFFTTKKDRGGTGLGLSVVYGIVKSYGGAIDVQSVVGQGAAFSVYLPCIGADGSGAKEKQKKETADLRGHERILFVDDEEMLVKMVDTFFQSLGYQIIATTSSLEALGLFHMDPQRFDLLITDMTMPNLNGLELSRAMLRARPDLPVILCTGHSDALTDDVAKKYNIREFILKPVSTGRLARLVRRTLDRRA